MGDPNNRRRHALMHARADRGELPEDFLLDVADAIERAETWIRDEVLPHYAQFHRGHGSELATRLFRDLETLLTPARLAPASWYKRRALQKRADAIQVTVLFGRSRDLSVLRYGRLTQIAILPNALWDGGFRDSAHLDDAVMRVLIGRFAQLMGPAIAPQADGDWEPSVALARERDSELVFRQNRKLASWSVVAALLALMLTAALQGW